jgi:elongation factor Ts
MAEITAKMVKELREKTGVGMMDCKKALTETNGDFDKAIEELRKKGMSKAEKRAGREAKEGIVQAYIHPGANLGVLVEVNCETDFVANTDDMKDFSKDIAMHIAAANPLVVKRDELDQELIEKEKEIYREQGKNEGKPDHIVEKIAEGRIEKYYKEVVLLEQQFVKDPDKTIQDMVNEKIAKIGENITIKRFARFRIGE